MIIYSAVISLFFSSFLSLFVAIRGDNRTQWSMTMTNWNTFAA